MQRGAPQELLHRVIEALWVGGKGLKKLGESDKRTLQVPQEETTITKKLFFKRAFR